ncbi:unnamed protein product, partial [marine sediment metagenome]
MPRKLFDIEISEITLCKSPANRKKFFIKKSEEKNMDTLIDKLKKFLSETDEDIDGALTKEQVEKIEKIDKKDQKEIEENLDVLSAYEDIPDDLEGSLHFFIKQAIDQIDIEEIDKAGAKLSKTTQTALKEIRAHIEGSPRAIEKLDILLGIEPKKTKKGGDGDENLSAETLARLERLEELEKKEKEELTKEADQKQEEKIAGIVNKALKDAGFKEIPQKKSIDRQA